MTSDGLAGFVDPVRVYSCADVLGRPSPVPAQEGVYGWWFGKLLPPPPGASWSARLWLGCVSSATGSATKPTVLSSSNRVSPART
jgi:hypothetical protein